VIFFFGSKKAIFTNLEVFQFKLKNALGIISLIFAVTFHPFDSYAQKSKQQLERERKENLKRIEEANKTLKETKHQKKATIGKLTVIKRKIETTTNIINTFSEEINLLDSEINETNSIIEALEEDLYKMKEEYAKMAYSAQKTSNSIDKLSFLFSSRSFHQLWMRLKYFEQYDEMRKRQIKAIAHINDVLQEKRALLNQKRYHKTDLLEYKVMENQNLTVIKEEHTQIVQELTKKESEIVHDLEERKKAIHRLDRLIAEIVKKEIERVNAEAKAKAKAEAEKRKANAKTEKERAKIDAELKERSVDVLYETPESKLINNSFQANKSQLLWPVKRGYVSQGFGRRPHPVLKGVMVENLGVDIQTNTGEEVRSVYDGKVSAVANVPGMGMVVMIQHGNYYTVYARLRNVSVSTGQKIKVKDTIGYVSQDQDEMYQLQFQIWRGSEKLDPEDWLLKK
jgi:septal ring factor EnvC (AmiA/AmiB activator)